MCIYLIPKFYLIRSIPILQSEFFSRRDSLDLEIPSISPESIPTRTRSKVPAKPNAERRSVPGVACMQYICILKTNLPEDFPSPLPLPLPLAGTTRLVPSFRHTRQREFTLATQRNGTFHFRAPGERSARGKKNLGPARLGMRPRKNIKGFPAVTMFKEPIDKILPCLVRVQFNDLFAVDHVIGFFSRTNQTKGPRLPDLNT
jgi:hypothetical protein